MNNQSANQPQTTNDSSADAKQQERAARLADGQITLAEYVGVNKQQLYSIAQQAHQLLNSGKLEEARDIYQGLVAADPYDSVFHCHLGATLLRLGKPDEAFEQFELSLQYNVANIDAFVGRGEIQLQRNKLPEAIADFTRALELDTEAKRASTKRARSTLIALKNSLEKQAAADAPTSGNK